jgi:hypothetical protein
VIHWAGSRLWSSNGLSKPAKLVCGFHLQKLKHFYPPGSDELIDVSFFFLFFCLSDQYEFLEIPRARRVNQSFVTSIFTTVTSLLVCLRFIALKPNVSACLVTPQGDSTDGQVCSSAVILNGPGSAVPIALSVFLPRVSSPTFQSPRSMSKDSERYQAFSVSHSRSHSFVVGHGETQTATNLRWILGKSQKIEPNGYTLATLYGLLHRPMESFAGWDPSIEVISSSLSSQISFCHHIWWLDGVSNTITCPLSCAFPLEAGSILLDAPTNE